jgi:hypothetical protein
MDSDVAPQIDRRSRFSQSMDGFFQLGRSLPLTEEGEDASVVVRVRVEIEK